MVTEIDSKKNMIFVKHSVMKKTGAEGNEDKEKH